MIRSMFDNVGSWLGYAVALATFIVAIFRDRRKGDIDESAVILGKWKEVNETTERRVEGLVAHIDKLETRLDRMDLALATAVARITELEAIVRRKDDEIIGLKRTIAQHSQSNAVAIGKAITRADSSDKRQDDSGARADASDERQVAFDDRATVNDERMMSVEDDIHRLDKLGTGKDEA